MCNQYQNWSQPYAGSTPFATVDPVCRPTCHVAGESPWITVIQCQCHPRWRSHESPPVLLIAESRFYCFHCRTCVGWDGVLISSTASAAFWSQQIGNSLSKILCRPGMSSFKTFTHVPLALWGVYAQQWSMQEEDTGDTDFVTSKLTSQFSATSHNTENAFCKFQVWLTIWKITWAFIDSLFQWAICHGWKIYHFFRAQFILLESIYILMPHNNIEYFFSFSLFLCLK